MKKSKIALAVAAASFMSTPVLATNGDVLIGLGTQSRALGGTGTAAYYGSENVLTNPSLLGKGTGTEFAIGGILFMPDVKSTSEFWPATGGTPESGDSAADMSLMPEVSLSNRINDNWTFGMGMYGAAGMGVDYRDEANLVKAYSSLQIMKFSPALAYNQGNFGFGIAPSIVYGALDLNLETSANVGNGVSSDMGTGFNLGAHFDINKDLTVAVSYQSSVLMEYENQITVAADAFNIGPSGMGVITSDELEQPAEIKVGVAYTMNNWMLTADAKQIKWGDAAGYKDFNWKDQNVYAVGAKYTGNGFWAGLGYNYGEDPIEVISGTAYADQAINLFNNLFFPGIVETHYTFGGGYSLSKTTTIEGAVVYVPEVTKTIDTSTITAAMGGSGTTSHTVDHNQISYSVSVRMNF
jgi:long-chain fatty acid transport protein